MIAAGTDPAWEETVKNIQQSAEDSIGFRKLIPRKLCITNEKMNLIKYLNKLRKTDGAMCRIIKKRITQKCKVGKGEMDRYNM